MPFEDSGCLDRPSSHGVEARAQSAAGLLLDGVPARFIAQARRQLHEIGGFGQESAEPL